MNREFFDFINNRIEPEPQPGLTPEEAHMLTVINRAREVFGVKPFIWDNRLAEVARDAVRHNWAYHENFMARVEQQGLAVEDCAEGSFPAQGPDETIEGLMRSMVSPKRRNGAHAKHFKSPDFKKVGVAYGGKADPDQPFFVIAYSK
jgi:uncharacterized protein YkwD